LGVDPSTDRVNPSVTSHRTACKAIFELEILYCRLRNLVSAIDRRFVCYPSLSI